MKHRSRHIRLAYSRCIISLKHYADNAGIHRNVRFFGDLAIFDPGRLVGTF